MLFNSIQGKQYHKANIKPRYFCEVLRLNEKQEEVEVSVKNALLASLEKEVL